MSWKDILKAKKPDFLDLDGDGNKKEPMSEAAKDIENQTDDEKYLASLNPQERRKVLEARKRVSQGIPSDAGQRPRIPQFKKILKGYKDDMEELRGRTSGYDPKDVIEYEKGYEDRQIKRMLTDIEEWAENFSFWEKTDIDNPIRFRKYRNEMFYYEGDFAPTTYSMEPAYRDGVLVPNKKGIYYMINNYFEDLDSGKKGELLFGFLNDNFDDFKLNPKLKNNPMKYKNEITQLYRDLTFERLIR